jgi:hypothetical protein
MSRLSLAIVALSFAPLIGAFVLTVRNETRRLS